MRWMMAVLWILSYGMLHGMDCSSDGELFGGDLVESDAVRWPSGCFLSLAVVEGPPVSALFEAIGEGENCRVKQLLDAGEPVNCYNEVGLQPIHVAAAAGCQEMLELLRAAGARVDAQDRLSGAQPLYYAVQERQLLAADYLLEAGAKANTVDSFGRAPLFIAAESEQCFMTRMLLEEGADPHCCDLHGESVLHRARVVGNRCIIRMLRRAARGDHLGAGKPGDTSTEDLSSCFSDDSDLSDRVEVVFSSTKGSDGSGGESGLPPSPTLLAPEFLQGRIDADNGELICDSSDSTASLTPELLRKQFETVSIW